MKNRVKLSVAADKNTFLFIPTLLFSREPEQFNIGIVFLCFGIGLKINKK